MERWALSCRLPRPHAAQASLMTSHRYTAPVSVMTNNSPSTPARPSRSAPAARMCACATLSTCAMEIKLSPGPKMRSRPLRSLTCKLQLSAAPSFAQLFTPPPPISWQRAARAGLQRARRLPLPQLPASAPQGQHCCCERGSSAAGTAVQPGSRVGGAPLLGARLHRPAPAPQPAALHHCHCPLAGAGRTAPQPGCWPGRLGHSPGWLQARAPGHSAARTP